MRFHTASYEDVKSGKITDVYFRRTTHVLRAAGIHKHVVMEATAASLPKGYEWAVLAGVEEVAALMEGVPCDVWTMEEGSVFYAGEPVLRVAGEYTVFGELETPILGLLCQASGVATKAARCRMAAGERPVISFGARRMHPVLAPMIERNAFIGGCDGVAVVGSAERLGIEASGTMPHTLILLVGDAAQAFKLYDEHTPPEMRRVCLVDTLRDEKFEALAAAEALGERLFAVRLDTPGSRRGDMLEIAREVRWELDLRGYQHVKIFVSGGVDEYEIATLNPVVDAYGVGTSISNAPTVNFGMDIVEIEGTPTTKRGKRSGVKEVFRCVECLSATVLPQGQAPPFPCACGGQWRPLLTPLTENGKLACSLPSPQEIRERVLGQLKTLTSRKAVERDER